MNGYLDYDQIPDVVINFDLPDRIVAAFGQAVADGRDSSANRVWNLGFNMASGRQYGPYGQPYAPPVWVGQRQDFFVEGTFGGVFGSVSSQYRTVTSIGFWTSIVSPPPPAPPFRPPPPPVPRSGPGPQPYNFGRVSGPWWGWPSDVAWDDTAKYSGAPSPHVDRFMASRQEAWPDWRLSDAVELSVPA